MRSLPLLLTAAVLLAAPVRAQPAPPPAQPSPPTITITLAELDDLVRALAEAPAKWTLPPLNFLLGKRAQATGQGAPPAP
ncbi:hypothetical protein UFOVP326_47 [uncultured Caudovirales phage]|uniref:Uncharacterized protein n=1 Tax=uncultured Caudovirales phage TaxID=2100421 RepID=A0A6J5M0X8_9CAUD|nr:hypothetical protein UFOVP326_47 [uncultured Caudovirales phage]